MASIYNSARNSTASLFDTVGTTAEALGQTVRMAARAVSALDKRVDLLHEDVSNYCTVQKRNGLSREITEGAMRHAEHMQSIHRKLYPNAQFDLATCYNEAVSDLTAHLELVAKQEEEGE